MTDDEKKFEGGRFCYFIPVDGFVSGRGWRRIRRQGRSGRSLPDGKLALFWKAWGIAPLFLGESR